MAAFPAMPLYTDAYLADTRHLTTEEHGAYLLLLMCAWRNANCALAEDDKSLARITGLTPARWRRMRPRLTPFFDVEGGLWQQQKLTSIHADVAARVARNRISGARGGRALAAKRQRGTGKRLSGKGAQKAAHKTVQQTDQDTLRQTGIGDDDHTNSASSESPANSPANSVATNLANSAAPSIAAKTKTKVKQPAAHENASESDVTSCPGAEPETGTESGPEAGTKNGPDSQEGWRIAIAGVCGPDTHMDNSVIQVWQAAGVDLVLDVLPTIKAVYQREITRTGKPPLRLGYYRDAVLEASIRRADASGGFGLARSCKGARAGGQNTKQAFDPGNADHWRQVLGDAGSAFRGDYMAQNWFIPSDHPVFQERTLGPNPRFGPNPFIPAEIHRRYAQPWHWRGQLKAQSTEELNGQSKSQPTRQDKDHSTTSVSKPPKP